MAFLPPPEGGDEGVAPGSWIPLPPSDLAGRSDASAVWTRMAMIVWGGTADSGVRGDGASFDLPSSTWKPLSPAPVAPRTGHSTVWTGTKMLVFGGLGISVGCERICTLGDGAAYDSITDTWAPLPPAPVEPRSGHSAVWVGNRMVVWGGAAEEGRALGDGASYDPVTGTWAPLPAPPLGPRRGHLAVATIDRMLVWGGSSGAQESGTYFADGAVYHPATDAWTPMSSAGALSAREASTGVWTGRQLLVWGGNVRSDACSPCVQGDGAAYDLDSDTWTPMSPSPLSGRAGHRAVWTGRDMLVWGGFDTAWRADGALYNPGTDSWSVVAPVAPLAPRRHHAMVWTGQQLLIWGGEGAGTNLADGAVLTLDFS